MIFNVYRTLRPMTKTDNLFLNYFKNQIDFKICNILKFRYSLKLPSFTSPFTPILSGCSVPSLDDGEAGPDMGREWKCNLHHFNTKFKTTQIFKMFIYKANEMLQFCILSSYLNNFIVYLNHHVVKSLV